LCNFSTETTFIEDVVSSAIFRAVISFSYIISTCVRRVQANQEGLKLNGTRQLLVYADDVNTLGGSTHSIKKNAEDLVIASK
jgi:hypothetical protein